MDLEGLISVSGKPGLFKVIGQSKNGVIVKNLSDGKKMAMSNTSKMSALQDIAIYTYTEEVPLEDVLELIRKKEDGQPAINHKSSSNELKNYFKEILPSFDEDRVYASDIKKVISWYNNLQKLGLAVAKVKDKTENSKETSSKDKLKKKAKTKANIKPKTQKLAKYKAPKKAATKTSKKG